MKKLLLLTSCFMLSYICSQAQVIVYVESPAAIMGNVTPFTWPPPGPLPDWQTPDLNNSANAIKDTLVLVHTGTVGDTLACDSIVNDLTGKIAVLYRGACEFGLKALNAQKKGAIGVIVINNAANVDPPAMGAGASGGSVTIPVVAITKEDGAVIRASMDAGNSVVAFIGSKLGLYANDLGFYAADVLIPRATANPALISGTGEYNAPLGAWVHNYGNTPHTGITLSAVISGAATATLTSTPVDIVAGDSTFVTLPTYSVSATGLHHVNYAVNYSFTDDFNSDNTFYSNFLIDSMFSYVYIDPITEKPVSTAHYKVGGTDGVYQTCIHFKDPNASRLAAMGIYFSAGGGLGGTQKDLTGITIEAAVYEWNNTFTGISDAAFPPNWSLNKIGTGNYTYGSNLQKATIYMPLGTHVVLQNDKRYLFCATSFNTDSVDFGYDGHFNYNQAILSHDQPVSIVGEGSLTDTTWYATGFGTDVTSSVSVLFGPYNLSVNENNLSFDVTPYPNPTAEFIKIPLKGMNGKAQLQIMDINGRVVNTQTVKVTETVTVNVAGITNGNYIFKMLFDDGRNTTFKVTISK